MARKQYEQFCLRFSMENPTHVKLFRIINNLDSDIYRSKNQFIMEALEAYVSGKSIDELCKKEKQEEEAPLTKQDLLEFGNQMREDLKQELYQEMLVRIADTMMSAIMRQPNGMQEQADQTETVSQKKEQTATAVILYKTEEYNFKNNIDFIFDQIKDYFEPSSMCYLNRYFCPSEKYVNDEDSGEVALGMNAYNFLLELIRECYEEGISYVDIRSFAFLVDHKKLMKLRNEYLIKKGNLVRNVKLDLLLDELVKRCKLLLNILIKYNIKSDKNTLLCVEGKLHEMLEIDRKVMEYTLNGLKR